MSIKLPDATLRLLADVGGTNVRFVLDDGSGCLGEVSVLATRDYPTLLGAIRHYLAGQGEAGLQVRSGAIGIANPVWGDEIRMTNHDWGFSIKAMRAELGWDSFQVFNDFVALAHALPGLADQDLLQVGGQQRESGAPRVLLGPGTGLGVGSLIDAREGPVAVAGEGGHVSFAPTTQEEVRLWAFMVSRFPHVSCERLLCGSGLSYIHAFLSGQPQASTLSPADLLDPQDITTAALAGSDRVCCQTVDLFCGLLGSAAGNMALALGARGGIYIGGGIIPRLGERFVTSPFRARLESKGRMSAYLQGIPAYVILSPYAALTGLSAAHARVSAQSG
ncbi:MAG: glucokinase [Comamonadaceae bacterium]|nr:MAG: glucokinase [Comamonadaceae bacterium]